MLAVYLSFRCVYQTDPRNPQGVFEVPQAAVNGYTMATMQKTLTHVWTVANGQCAKSEALEEKQALTLSPETLKNQYPYFYQSLFNLINRAEGLLK
jgi:hypothetical protein